MCVKLYMQASVSQPKPNKPKTADCHDGSKMNDIVFLFKTQRKFGSTDCPTLLLVNRLVTNDDCTLCVSCHRQFSMCVQLDVQRRVDK